MSNSFHLSSHLWHKIVVHVKECLPNEACGLIGGNNNVGQIVIPVPNDLNSPTKYRMQPEEQLAGLIRIEELGYELLVIYHSHPHGPTHPSRTDIKQFFYPGVGSLILSRQNGSWQGRLFHIFENTYEENPIVILKDP